MTLDNLPWLILGAGVLVYLWVYLARKLCVCGHEEGSHIELEGEKPICLGGEMLCRCRGFEKH